MPWVDLDGLSLSRQEEMEERRNVSVRVWKRVQAGLRGGDGGRVWGWVGGGLRPLPCHHIPRHPSKVTHCGCGLLVSHHYVHYWSTVNSLNWTHIIFWSACMRSLTCTYKLFLFIYPHLFSITGQFITGPAWLRKEVRCQQYKSLTCSFSWHCGNSAIACLHICWVIYCDRNSLAKTREGEFIFFCWPVSHIRMPCFFL